MFINKNTVSNLPYMYLQNWSKRGIQKYIVHESPKERILGKRTNFLKLLYNIYRIEIIPSD